MVPGVMEIMNSQMWTCIGRKVDGSGSTGIQTIGGEQGQKIGDVAPGPPALGGGGRVWWKL